MSSLAENLLDYGAARDTYVDLRDGADARLLRYTDLVRDPDQPLVDGVVEQQARALLYVVDQARLRHGGRSISELRRLLAMRGEPAWLGVLRPGRMDIYATDPRPDPEAEPAPFPSNSPGAQAVLPRLAQGEALAPPSRLHLRDELLRLMTHAGEELRSYGLSTHETIALIGRALFFRYLMGRRIVNEAHRPWIVASAQSLKACFASAASLAETNRWLDETFNGDLLALPSQNYSTYFGRLIRKHGQQVTRPLNAIMALDTAVSPGTYQQSLDWGDLDFDHLPIGLLSETYERLMERLDAEARRDTSVYYTPFHIAEYMVEEALYAHPAGAAARVLDPACGAGVFLVACFRKLAELHFRQTGQRPDRQTLRTILEEQLTGFDTNAHARTLAALALYLTALELDPHPTPVEELRFEKLEGNVLIDVADPGSCPDMIVPMAGSLGEHVSKRFRGAFDLVIGNPPWTSLKPQYVAIDRLFTQRCQAVAAERGFADIARTYHNPDRVPDLPFVWGAMEWAKPGGRIALALAGRWLFKQSPKGFAARKALFRALAVTGILNGAALRKTKVWPSVDQPFCLLFADNRVPEEDECFMLVSPNYEPALSDQGRMRVDAYDAMPVAIDFVVERPAAIKMLYRGTTLDIAIVERVQQRAKYTIGSYWKPERGLHRGQGYQVAKQDQDDTFLVGKPTLQADYSAHPFRVLEETLERYESQGLQWPRNPEIYKAPILLVRKGNRADRTRGRALIGSVDLAYSESYYGYSAAHHPQGEFLVRYLLVLVHSRLFEYMTLMTSGEFGVEREALQVMDINQFPFIPPEQLSAAQRQSIEQCVEQLIANRPDWKALDRAVAQLYGLTARDQRTMADTLDTRAPFPAALERARRAVTTQERERFRAQLEDELSSVFAASGHRVCARLLPDQDGRLPWRFLSISLDGRPLPPALPGRWIEQVDDLAASRITLLDAQEPSLTVGLLNQYRYWTPTQARLLASDLIWQYGALLEERAGQ